MNSQRPFFRRALFSVAAVAFTLLPWVISYVVGIWLPFFDLPLWVNVTVSVGIAGVFGYYRAKQPPFAVAENIFRSFLWTFLYVIAGALVIFLAFAAGLQSF
jgi:hypothetical protein